MTSSLAVICVVAGLGVCTVAKAETPIRMIGIADKPMLAVFEYDQTPGDKITHRKEAYYLGCMDIFYRWEGVTHMNVTSDVWAKTLVEFPAVGGIPCGSPTIAFAGPAGTPGGIIIPHNAFDEKGNKKADVLYVHYVNEGGLRAAVRVPVIQMTGAELERYPRGVDFTAKLPVSPRPPCTEYDMPLQGPPNGLSPTYHGIQCPRGF